MAIFTGCLRVRHWLYRTYNDYNTCNKPAAKHWYSVSGRCFFFFFFVTRNNHFIKKHSKGQVVHDFVVQMNTKWTKITSAHHPIKCWTPKLYVQDIHELRKHWRLSLFLVCYGQLNSSAECIMSDGFWDDYQDEADLSPAYQDVILMCL